MYCDVQCNLPVLICSLCLQFWKRSHVTIGGNSTGDAAPFKLNQQYVLFRYLQKIQGNGTTQIHFNGGLVDWGATGNPSTPHDVQDHGSPDYRDWGDAFWFQNCR